MYAYAAANLQSTRYSGASSIKQEVRALTLFAVKK